MPDDLYYMQLALAEAQAAAEAGEVPIGAVLIHSGAIMVRSGNRTIRNNDPTAHAEIVVIREMSQTIHNYRLTGATLYVTLEPCAMCAGAIIQARISRVVYGADDPKAGAVQSIMQVLNHPQLNHRIEVRRGVLAGRCAELLQTFFKGRR